MRLISTFFLYSILHTILFGQCELPITNPVVTPLVSVAGGMKASQSFTIPNCTAGVFSQLTIFTETNNSDVTLRICPGDSPSTTGNCYVQTGINWQVTSPESFTILLNTSDPLLNYEPETSYTFQLSSDTPLRLGINDIGVDVYPSGTYYNENDAAQANQDMFFLFTTETILPVRLSSFTGEKNGPEVQLQWVTAAEINNRGFQIERSQDGSRWVTIGFEPAKQDAALGSTYQFTDTRPLSESSFYRLKQIDFDGAFSYSPLIELAGRTFEKLAIFPNPIRKGEMLKASKVTRLVIFGQRGEVLFEATDFTDFHQIPSDLPSGFYITQLTTLAGQTETRRLVIH